MRVSARMTGAALVVTAALALTGCNGSTGSSHSHGKKHKSGSSSHKSSSSKHKSSAGGSTGGSSVSTSAIKGSWEHGKIMDDDYVHLTLLDQDNGVVVTTPKASCIGTFEDIGRYVAMHTECKKGHGYESGTVKSYRNGTLTVAWDGGTTQAFKRTEDM